MGVLLKKLGVPVVTVITQGAFARDPLYNCLQKRKVKVSAKVRCLATPEELKAMTVAELDAKLGRLFWLSSWLLEQQILFEICVLTGNGVESWPVRETWDLDKCMESLLCAPFAPDGAIRDRDFTAACQCYIGGEQGET